MQNYKTTICGIITALSGFVVANPSMFAKWPIVGTIAGFIMAGGLAGIGVFAKDATTHSTMVQVQVATNQKQQADLQKVNTP